MLRRDFLQLLKGAGSALFLPADALSVAALPQLPKLFPDHLLDGFMDSGLLGVLRFGQKQQAHPYDDFASAGNQLTSLISCLDRTDFSRRSYVPPEVYLLNILAKDSLWNNSRDLTVSMQDWAVFGSALEKRTQTLAALTDSDLLKSFPKSALMAQKPELAEDSFSDPLVFKIASLNIKKMLGEEGLCGSIKSVLGFYRQTNQDIITATDGVARALSNSQESKFANHPDVFELLRHLQNSGFSPFVSGSRLAELQTIARLFRQFKNLNGSQSGFNKFKSLAEEISKRVEETGFKLPQRESLDSARISHTFSEHHRRDCGPRRINISHQNQMLDKAKVPEDFCLIYNYTNKGPIIDIFMPAPGRFMPLHVCYKENTKNTILDIIWENCSSELLVGRAPLMLRISRASDNLVVKPIELAGFN